MALFLPDANVLIHALRQESLAHHACRGWLVELSARGDELGLTELVEAALLRIPTMRKLQLVSMADVLAFWAEDLWTFPGTRRLVAGKRHSRIFSGFITDLHLWGDDVNDAWLAALALEHRATLVSTDRGFARFPGLTWLNPAGNSQVA